MAENRVLKIGVAGLRRGLGFARLFAARGDCRVAAVCDPNADRAAEAAGAVGAAAFTDYNSFCDQDLDAVVIVTPPSTHFSCSVRALEAGKHVLCEVPAVVSLEEARRLEETVRRTNRKYMIAENVCYFPCIQEMERIVRAGQIGQVVLAEGEYVHDCREIMFNRDDGLGGGVGERPTWRMHLDAIQYSTHELGPLLMMTDDRIISASCQESAFPDPAKPDVIATQTALFKTAGGRTIRELVAFKIVREPAHHFFCLYGTKGSVETDRYRWCENLKCYAGPAGGSGQLTDIPINPIHPDAPLEALAGGHGTSEYYMVADFVRAIVDDQSAPLDVYWALEMSVPGVCAAMSARQGGQPVAVPDYRPCGLSG